MLRLAINYADANLVAYISLLINYVTIGVPNQ